MNAFDKHQRELYIIYLMYITFALEVEQLCKNFIYGQRGKAKHTHAPTHRGTSTRASVSPKHWHICFCIYTLSSRNWSTDDAKLPRVWDLDRCHGQPLAAEFIFPLPLHNTGDGGGVEMFWRLPRGVLVKFVFWNKSHEFVFYSTS